MKNLNESTFNVTKTTMRELNNHEINNVSGATALSLYVSIEIAEEIIEDIVEVVTEVITTGG